jgi:hypothetical protein
MTLSDSLLNTLGTTGVIALLLAIVFGVAAILNALRKQRLHLPPSAKSGPIIISDPHTGRPIVNPAVHPDLSAVSNPVVPPSSPSVPTSLHAPAPSPPTATPSPSPPPARPIPPREPSSRPTTETREPLAKGASLFRQLDPRGVEVETSRPGRTDEYLWE